MVARSRAPSVAPEDGAAAAEDRHPAYDDRGDHLELVADACDRVDRRVVGQPQGTGDPGDRTAQDEGEEHARPDRDAGEACRVRIRPDRVEVARRAEAAHRIGRDHDGDDRDDREVGNAGDGAVADLVEALRQHRGVDLVPACPRAVDPPDDVERAQRHDQAGDAGERDDRPVDRTEAGADRQREQENDRHRDVRVMPVERPACVRRDAEHRSDREVDVAGDHDDGLADREQRDDRRAGERSAARWWC